MTVKYNRLFAVLFLVLGGINLLLGGWLLLLGEFQFTLILGILLTFIGIQYFRAPYFIVEPGQVMIPALIGPIKRSYPIVGTNGIKMENGKLLAYDGQQWKGIPVQKWLSDGTDWQALEQQVSAS